MGDLEPGLVALSGVFTTSFGAWTVPVVFDSQANPSMADPLAESTFKQGFNNYHPAKLGLYDAVSDSMHEILFGGISLQTLDTQSGQVLTDHDLPFVNDITAVRIDSAREFQQTHVGFFPEVHDPHGQLWRFGANAEFFPATGVPAYENGVLKLDQLSGPTVLGHIFGGIMTNGPHTRGFPDVVSTASSQLFEVTYIPVPEASAVRLAGVCGSFLCSMRLTRALYGTDGSGVREF